MFAALIGYFGYQWWFNPARAVKQRLGEVAARCRCLTTKPTWPRRAARAAARYLADDLTSTSAPRSHRATRPGARGGWKPRPGAATSISPTCRSSSSPTAAHAYLAVELTSLDARAALDVDSRDASVSLAKRTASG